MSVNHVSDSGPVPDELYNELQDQGVVLNRLDLEDIPEPLFEDILHGLHVAAGQHVESESDVLECKEIYWCAEYVNRAYEGHLARVARDTTYHAYESVHHAQKVGNRQLCLRSFHEAALTLTLRQVCHCECGKAHGARILLRLQNCREHLQNTYAEESVEVTQGTTRRTLIYTCLRSYVEGRHSRHITHNLHGYAWLLSVTLEHIWNPFDGGLVDVQLVLRDPTPRFRRALALTCNVNHRSGDIHGLSQHVPHAYKEVLKDERKPNANYVFRKR
mmetsp:Transcript_161493/g.297928  ORF Transcript_161493/g.297928 Transcript_161493/m.297928 type:complete len:274 (+) Transcript_161493:794-1615(+)